MIVETDAVQGSPLDATKLRVAATEIRRAVIDMCLPRNRGYAGQGLALADFLACLFFAEMRRRPDCPDRFVLSTGHSAIALYAALSVAGEYAQSDIATYGGDGSLLEESPLEGTPGFLITGGSLGQGLSQSVGLALSDRLAGRRGRTFCLASDGELQEGQVWEAAMSASHLKLSNLTLIVDHNDMQADGRISSVMGVQPIGAKLTAFGFETVEINGHSTVDILHALETTSQLGVLPYAIILNTEPMRGVKCLLPYRNLHYLNIEREVWVAARDELA